jgi:molybdopterin converting factor small subunit
MSEEKKTFTQEEVQKMVQSETDKVRTEYSKTIKELKEKLPEEKNEKELELEQRVKELEHKEQLLNLKENLSQKGFNSELADFLKVDTDIEKLGELLKVNNKDYVPSNKKKTDSKITKEDFIKMGYMEKLKLYETNPELYKQLTKK